MLVILFKEENQNYNDIFIFQVPMNRLLLLGIDNGNIRLVC